MEPDEIFRLPFAFDDDLQVKSIDDKTAKTVIEYMKNDENREYFMLRISNHSRYYHDGAFYWCSQNIGDLRDKKMFPTQAFIDHVLKVTQ